LVTFSPSLASLSSVIYSKLISIHFFSSFGVRIYFLRL
jgi:hypothetical protein